MEEFKQYSKLMELRPITQEEIDEYDETGGIMYDGDSARYALTIGRFRPRIGYMVARDPKNHNNQWLVTESEFKTYKEHPPIEMDLITNSERTVMGLVKKDVWDIIDHAQNDENSFDMGNFRLYNCVGRPNATTFSTEPFCAGDKAWIKIASVVK